jgi:hypothetical protein
MSLRNKGKTAPGPRRPPMTGNFETRSIAMQCTTLDGSDLGVSRVARGREGTR